MSSRLSSAPLHPLNPIPCPIKNITYRDKYWKSCRLHNSYGFASSGRLAGPPRRLIGCRTENQEEVAAAERRAAAAVFFFFNSF